MTVWQGLALTGGSVLLVFGIWWYWWNWYRDWVTRLKKHLPPPPLNHLWELITSEGNFKDIHDLRLFNVIEERSVFVGSVTVDRKKGVPTRDQFAWLLIDARNKAKSLTPEELRHQQRFL